MPHLVAQSSSKSFYSEVNSWCLVSCLINMDSLGLLRLQPNEPIASESVRIYCTEVCNGFGPETPKKTSNVSNLETAVKIDAINLPA